MDEEESRVKEMRTGEVVIKRRRDRDGAKI